MNERIKELKEQSMEWVPNMADPNTKIRLLNAGKFAELIVKECIETLRLVPYNSDRDFGDEAIYQEAILKHFGVEE